MTIHKTVDDYRLAGGNLNIAVGRRVASCRGQKSIVCGDGVAVNSAERQADRHADSTRRLVAMWCRSRCGALHRVLPVRSKKPPLRRRQSELRRDVISA
jgi:hypothetical protein